MLVCAALWSTGGILIKLIDWNPFVIAGVRSLLAAATIGIYMAVTRQKVIFSKNTVISMFFLAATFICFVTANKFTTAANAIVLEFTSPIFIVLFSALLFRQKFKASELAIVLLTFAGITLFFITGLQGGQLFGNILGILAGVFVAGMYITVGQATDGEKMSGILLGQLLTALIGLPFAFFTQGTVSVTTVSAVVVLGVLQIGIPYIFLGLAVRYCPPLPCCLIGAVEPLLNPVWVLLFNGERPGPFALVGGVIIIAAVTAQCVLQAKAPARESAPA
ncbi:Threonine/homoserine efflux transporter RhtA [Sporobacter termitidis DSM 10068]|uniref:Threonine/homoserine efflux transporter RhtA n=2 Tax=Sporobacter TaxID=44748 RepID=A0A1M5XNL0_9FIRM|nr:Threonine/homoserine efflux transporter RhtA [Sporobacter termitidis DSM 10068]